MHFSSTFFLHIYTYIPNHMVLLKKQEETASNFQFSLSFNINSRLFFEGERHNFKNMLLNNGGTSMRNPKSATTTLQKKKLRSEANILLFWLAESFQVYLTLKSLQRHEFT